MDRETLIRNMPLFETLADDEVLALAGQLQERTVAAGTTIFRAGEPGDTLFLIQEGAVEISTGDGKQRTVRASSFPGPSLAEISLLDGSARPARARVLLTLLL